MFSFRSLKAKLLEPQGVTEWRPTFQWLHPHVFWELKPHSTPGSPLPLSFRLHCRAAHVQVCSRSKGTTFNYSDSPIFMAIWLSFGLPKFSWHGCIYTVTDIVLILCILCVIPRVVSFLGNSDTVGSGKGPSVGVSSVVISLPCHF